MGEPYPGFPAINKAYRDMRIFKISVVAMAAILASSCFISCSDANEYEDTNAANPSWAGQYNDSLKIAHPESVAGSYWVRGAGLKTNAYGEEIQGYVESLDFVDDTYVVVKMSKGVIPESIKATATWSDDSNTDNLPQYEYRYSETTGTVEILKETRDDKGKVSKATIFTAVVVSGQQDVLTIAHFGDTPVQTYLVKGQKPAASTGDTPSAE